MSGADRRGGFTLVELLVVIAIVAVVAGITLGTVVRMQARGNVGACIVKLKAISQAMAMYRLDEGAYPPAIPWALAEGEPANGGQGFDHTCLDPNLPCDRPGLWALYDLGYLSSERVLVCPQNPFEGQGSRDLARQAAWGDLFQKLHGYENRDDVTGEWKYLPDRSGDWPDVTNTESLDYNRHLRARYPSGTTVVLWCPYHRNTFTEGGVGVDLLLYLDGHVEKRRRPEDPSEPRAMLYPEEG